MLFEFSTILVHCFPSRLHVLENNFLPVGKTNNNANQYPFTKIIKEVQLSQ